MTEYVYQVRSNRPLNVMNGIGNHPVVMVDPHGQGLVQRDVSRSARSNGSAAADGHEITIELLERNEPACPACGHPIDEHYGRWCRVPTGAVNAQGSRLICCCEAVEAPNHPNRTQEGQSND